MLWLLPPFDNIAPVVIGVNKLVSLGVDDTNQSPETIVKVGSCSTVFITKQAYKCRIDI